MKISKSLTLYFLSGSLYASDGKSHFDPLLLPKVSMSMFSTGGDKSPPLVDLLAAGPGSHTPSRKSAAVSPGTEKPGWGTTLVRTLTGLRTPDSAYGTSITSPKAGAEASPCVEPYAAAAGAGGASQTPPPIISLHLSAPETYGMASRTGAALPIPLRFSALCPSANPLFSRTFLVESIKYQEIIMDTWDNQCGFYALNTNRDEGSNLLRNWADNEHVQNMLAAEIAQQLIENDINIKSLTLGHATLEISLLLAMTKRSENKTHIFHELTTLLSNNLVIIKNYIAQCIAAPRHMLTVESGFGEDSPIGSMDIIAMAKGFSLEVYTISDATQSLTLFHKFDPKAHGFEGEFKTRQLILTSADPHTAPTALNHFNILRAVETPHGAKS